MDAPNRLHFYVVDLRKDEDGILVYTLAARSLDGSGPQERGVALAAPPAAAGLRVKEPDTPVAFTLTNTGRPAGADADAVFDADVYRLSVSIEGRGWTARLPNGLAAVKCGASQPVTVYLARDAKSAKTATVTLRATSESDPTKSATAAAKLARKLAAPKKISFSLIFFH